jgi:hypothetical protein
MSQLFAMDPLLDRVIAVVGDKTMGVFLPKCAAKPTVAFSGFQQRRFSDRETLLGRGLQDLL